MPLISPYRTQLINPYGSSQRATRPYSLPAVHDGRFGFRQSMTEPIAKPKQKREIKLPGDFAGEKNPDYLCLIFHGRRGRGKSTGATAFARFLFDQQKAMNPNYKVFANYKVNFADMCHPRLVDALITFPEWLHDCLILIDEIAVYFPGLRATSTAALNFSTFLQEIRKLRVDLIFTTQFPTMIIGNASIQIDCFIEPYLYHKVYEPRVKAWVNNSMIMNCCDWWGQWSGYPVHHRWPPEPEDTIAAPKLHMIRNIYHQFNTNEIIPAFWHPSRDSIMERQWTSEFEAEREAEEELLAKENPEPVLVKANKEPQTLQELLDVQPGSIELRSILKQAGRIDPQIKNYSQLATAMRRLGWSCYQTGKNGPWIGEACETE